MRDLYDNHKTVIISLLVTGGLLVIILLSLVGILNTKSDLENEHIQLLSEYDEISKAVDIRMHEINVLKHETVMKATGVDPELILLDRNEAIEFFEPAFEWEDGTEYDERRDLYKEALGEDNALTLTYLPEPIRVNIGTSEEEEMLSQIDHEGLKSQFGELELVPLRIQDNRISYVAFVTYFVHTNEGRLNNPNVSDASEAIVHFTVSGDPTEGERTLSEVKVWNTTKKYK